MHALRIRAWFRIDIRGGLRSPSMVVKGANDSGGGANAICFNTQSLGMRLGMDVGSLMF
jgi:hypothetical protein